MIFATCGSSHFQFARMMDALATLSPASLCVQHGPAIPPPCAHAHSYLSFEAIMAQIDCADVIVTHAGVGTVLCAVQAGHTPVLFPRLSRYSEAVDDHQAEFAEALAQTGRALVAWTAEELADAVAAVPPRRLAALSVASRPLVHAVREKISGPSLELVSSAAVISQ